MAEHIAQVQRAFSAYAIEKAVGSGGMATVYRAHDKKHKRKVAIKVLHAEVAALVGSKRFLQEIRITAKLQHPHILGLIDSGILGEGAGELAGRPYYVMPYIDGESLRQRLEREKLLPITDTVRLVTEIASALDYAHRQGIIHRDVKPENILLHDGSAIVADFGIALAVTHAGVSRLTETGTTLGTPFYMSPEQAMGERALTGRSDIYSLGALCYELLAGEPPFTGKTQQAIVARIITDEPRALSTVRRSVPPHVASAVSQALEKIPADRFATAHEFATALSSPAVTPSTSIPALEESNVAAGAGARPVVRAAASNRPLYAVGALAILMAVVALWGWLRPRPASPVLGYRLVFDSTEAMVAGGSYTTRLALSPDGSRFAYIGGPKAQLFILPRNQLRGTAVPGTEALNTPFFSPDGHYVGVMADNNLQAFSLTGGPRMHITDTLVGVAGASWARDGFIYADGAGFERLLRVEAKPNAVPKWFTTLDTASREFDHLWPDALPNGKGVLFTVASRVKNSTLNTWAFSIAVADIPSGKHKVLVNNAKFARYSPSGHLLYVTSDRKLMVAPFDQASMRVTGEPALLSENMRLGTLGSADLTVSATGTLLYGTGGGQPANQLVWVTRDGKAQPVDSAWTGLFRSPAISPDGSRLAVERGSEIWTKQLDGGPSLRLAFEGTENTFPWWTPDGRSITYTSTAASSYDIWTKKADGSAPAVRQLHMQRGVFGPVWSPDGTWLIVRTDESATGALGSPSGVMPDILGMRPGIDSAPQPLVATKFTEEAPAFSPDGRWLAYSSDESGEKEVYVVPFPNTSAAKWPISSRGGREPVWSHSGRELFYRDDAGNMVAVAVQTNPTFSPGRSTVLFQARGYVARAFPAQYAVSRDDRRFLMIRPLPIAPDELVVVENWFQELQSRVRK